MPELAIEMADVSKRFGATQSLDHLDLEVPYGAVFGFLGPNGAGKTTSLRALLGLVRPDAGRVRVLGLDPQREARAIRAQVGVLLEHDGLYDRLSAWHNLDFHARIHHLPPARRAARIEALLRSFDLWERRRDPVVLWSKGMRQKLAVARALLHAPRLLLLDEPFSGLDPVAAVDLRGRIAALARQENVTVVLTTHDLAHVEKSCSDVAVIQAGRVIARGAPDALATGAAPLEVEVVGQGLSEDLLADMQREELLVAFRLDGRAARITCSSDQGGRLGTELVRRGVVLEELRTLRGTLEDAFLALFAAPKGERS